MSHAASLEIRGRAKLYLPVKRLVDLAAGAMFVLLSLSVWFFNRFIAKRIQKSGFRLMGGSRSLVGPSKKLTINRGVRIRRGIINEHRISLLMDMESSANRSNIRYIQNFGLKKDLALFLRGAWVFLMAGQDVRPTTSQYFNLFDIIVNNSDTESIIATIEKMIQSHPRTVDQMLASIGQKRDEEESPNPLHITFVNANNFNLAIENEEYRNVLKRADLVLPDGIGVKLGLRMAGGRLRKNLNGTDLLPHIIDMLNRNEWSLYLLGATDDTLEKAKNNLEKKYPGVKVAGTRNGYFKPDDEKEISDEINRSKTFAVIVGMGTPRQELFVDRNLVNLQIPIVFSMGGLLDFIGEKNRRAPLWMRQAGLEWVYRIIQEPGRMWKRYVIGNPLFLYRALRWIRSDQMISTSTTIET